MTNTLGTDILIQAPDPDAAAAFYVRTLGFAITSRTATLVSVEGPHINLYIEKGDPLGPVLEVTVDDVTEAKARLVAAGGKILKDEPEFPRCYVQDPFGLTYNLRS